MKKIFFILFTIFFLCFAFYMNNINYKKHKEIQKNIVNHPTYIETKTSASFNSFWFKNLKADFYWLETIQYIWENALNSEYKKYLYKMIDLITELNPYFEKPYIIWELLLPDYNPRYEKLSEKEQENYINQAIKIWQKWIKNFCDTNKLKLIKKENNLNKLFQEKKYQNPCKSWMVPFQLAFIYFFYKNNPSLASYYYKIASVSPWAPEWAKVQIAIMQWKWWNREKSFFMFLNMAYYIEPDNKNCLDFSTNLENIWKIYFTTNQNSREKILKNLEKIRKEFFPFKDEEKTTCGKYINKSIRELNLFYIQKWNKLYKEKFWKNSKNASELFQKWYINYLPKDFQQYKDYGIIYIYNNETWTYDTKMWNY